MKVAGYPVEPEVAGTPCAACIESKQLLKQVGGIEIRKLFNLTGRVMPIDSWGGSIGKGIKRNTRANRQQDQK